MILKAISAATLLVLSTASWAQNSGSTTQSSTGPGAGASGSAEMGRGRCEALSGAEQEKCLTDERTTAASGASRAEVGRGRCEALTGAEKEKCLTEQSAASVAVPAPQRSDERK
jgi:hypothetical protein